VLFASILTEVTTQNKVGTDVKQELEKQWEHITGMKLCLSMLELVW